SRVRGRCMLTVPPTAAARGRRLATGTRRRTCPRRRGRTPSRGGRSQPPLRHRWGEPVAACGAPVHLDHASLRGAVAGGLADVAVFGADGSEPPVGDGPADRGVELVGAELGGFGFGGVPQLVHGEACPGGQAVEYLFDD